MTSLTIFTLGRSTSIPFSTVTIAHHIINCKTKNQDSSFVAEVLILNHWFDRKVADNDAILTVRKL